MVKGVGAGSHRDVGHISKANTVKAIWIEAGEEHRTHRVGNPFDCIIITAGHGDRPVSAGKCEALISSKSRLCHGQRKAHPNNVF
ncbi:hypothetical protein D3C72_1196750 [compost metagenome]